MVGLSISGSRFLVLFFFFLTRLHLSHCQLCGSQWTVENSEGDGNTRPPDLPLEKPVWGQEATFRTEHRTTGHRTTDWFQIGKGVCQGCILSPCLFNSYAQYIMRNTGLEEAQAGTRLLGEISITSDMQMTPPLWQRVKRNWKASW